LGWDQFQVNLLTLISSKDSRDVAEQSTIEEQLLQFDHVARVDASDKHSNPVVEDQELVGTFDVGGASGSYRNAKSKHEFVFLPFSFAKSTVSCFLS
jgi:hypothetical protein